MSLIEGVGDEVTNFFIAVGVLLVGWLAWCSTGIADQPLIRTVLILQHRTRTRIAELRANQTLRTPSLPPTLESLSEEVVEASSNAGEASETPRSAIDTTDGESNATATAATSEEVLIETMDSFNGDESELRRRMVRKTDGSNAGADPAPAVGAERASDEAPSTDDSQINIKLMFINDDQKLVTGSPKEMLGEFKRRHFQMELDSQKLVRLVFNGHVLQPDSQTLERCGLYNNCVVHCLVHQSHPSPVAASQSSAFETSSSMYFNHQTFQDLPAGTAGLGAMRNEWDLSRLLVSILTLVLGLAWYSRYQYAQLFTATTTLALYALTAIFTVSLYGHFFPDQDGIRNIE